MSLKNSLIYIILINNYIVTPKKNVCLQARMQEWCWLLLSRKWNLLVLPPSIASRDQSFPTLRIIKLIRNPLRTQLRPWLWRIFGLILNQKLFPSRRGGAVSEINFKAETFVTKTHQDRLEIVDTSSNNQQTSCLEGLVLWKQPSFQAFFRLPVPRMFNMSLTV